MKYKDFYQHISEEKFKKRKGITHLADVPMFSIYIADVVKNDPRYTKKTLDELKHNLDGARTEIHKIGFPSMHANVVIDDIKRSYPKHPTAAGLAVNRQFMVIDINHLYDAKRIVVHEWSHLWMYQRPKLFKKAITDMYNNMIRTAGSKFGIVTYDDLLKGTLSPKYKLAAKLSDLFPDRIYTPVVVALRNVFVNLIKSPNSAATKYLLIGKKFSKKLIEFLPHNFRFETTLNQPLTVTSFDGNSEELHVGTLVYVEKGSSEWIIGIRKYNTSYETTITYDAADTILGTDIYEKIDQILKVRRGAAPVSKKQLEKEILLDLKSDMDGFINSSLRRYVMGYKLTQEESDMINSWIEKYIFPIYLYVLRNSKEYNRLNSSTASEIYSYMWITNKLRPGDISFMQFLSFLYNRQKLSASDRIVDLGFVGDEHRSIRTLMAELVEWVNEYGLSNDLELWATAIELFFKLPLKYRTTIVKLMV